jgi:hypothetical protein
MDYFVKSFGKSKIGLDELNPQPYWGFNDLANIVGTKLFNCFYLQVKVKKLMVNNYIITIKY